MQHKARLVKKGCLLCKTGSFADYERYKAHIDLDSHKKVNVVSVVVSVVVVVVNVVVVVSVSSLSSVSWAKVLGVQSCTRRTRVYNTSNTHIICSEYMLILKVGFM